MALITISYGAKASSSVLNNNFRYLAELLQSQIQSLTAAVNNSRASLESIAASFAASIYKIGDPKITLSDTLQDNEIWLFGSEVSKSTYANLYAIYGDTYGEPETEGNFLLPDFRDKALWGGEEFGYLDSGLPNLSGVFGAMASAGDGVLFQNNGSAAYAVVNAAGYNYSIKMDASKYNEIYGASETVQPPSIIVRVKTRYE